MFLSLSLPLLLCLCVHISAFYSFGGSSVGEAIWILKPASYANRGFGIKVVQGLDAVLANVQRPSTTAVLTDRGKAGLAQSSSPTLATAAEAVAASLLPPSQEKIDKAARRCAKRNGWICQEYMLNPLLVSGRKFDIRCFVVLVNTRKEGPPTHRCFRPRTLDLYFLFALMI